MINNKETQDTKGRAAGRTTGLCPAEAGGALGRPKVIYGEATARVRRVSGETPVWVWGKRDETRITRISTEGSDPALVGRQSHGSCKSV